ncbi:Hsp20/alpha crystallin family protein [Draconibacterium sp.]|nr:Hsp20/alpha crystallin family protein [Draconibacterium sp.]
MNLVRFHNPRYSTNKVLVDELFNNFLKNDHHESYLHNCGSKPATNIFETEKEFKLEVLLPGYKKDDVQINLNNNLLTIKVENEVKEEKSGEYKYAHREFGAYNFEKQYHVPKSVNGDNISARFENGVLNIELPKKEEALEKAPVEIKIS